MKPATDGNRGAREAELPNSGRQPELDAARGLAVFFMIAVHTLETLGTPVLAGTWFGYMIEILGGPPAAPVFMAVLGVGIVYSSKATPRRLARRGVLLLALGYLLNLLRGVGPALVGFFSEAGHIGMEVVLAQLFSVDIFHFAGLTFLFFAGWTSIRGKDWWLVGVPAAAIAVNTVLNAVVGSGPTGPLIVNAAAGLIWGAGPVSYFPFLSWITYPVLGYLFGRRLIRTLDKRRLYAAVSAVGLVLFLGGFFIGSVVLDIDIGFENEYAYYHHGLVGTVILTGFTFFWLGVVYLLKFLTRGVVGSTLKRWSSNVSAIYFIHWVMLGWAALILGPNSRGALGVGSVIIALVTVSDLIASLWVRWSQGGSRESRSRTKGAP